jgi:hypothetical protein
MTAAFAVCAWRGESFDETNISLFVAGNANGGLDCINRLVGYYWRGRIFHFDKLSPLSIITLFMPACKMGV